MDGHRIGLGMRIESTREFNQRAAIALNGCTLSPFAQRIHARLKAGDELAPQDQGWLYRIVHERRSQITDDLVIEYAASRVRGSD